jgi:hypothetical protein
MRYVNFYKIIKTQHSRNIAHCEYEGECLRYHLNTAPGFGVFYRLERLYAAAGL